MAVHVNIEASWAEVLKEEFEKPYFEALVLELKRLKSAGIKIYPPGPLIFKAYDATPFHAVRAVIIGQDPYHGPGQAMGLCFSVPRDVPIPASLKNIYKEMKSDIGFVPPRHGDLSEWTAHGVFMLNAILTVEHKNAGSHRKLGWQQFTDATISAISKHRDHVVFLLWGNYARGKKDLIDSNKHTILEAAHPSPLARGAYFGSRHFSKTNAALQSRGMSPINWNLSQ